MGNITIGTKVVFNTTRKVKTLVKNVIKNDILIIVGIMGKGGYSVTDALGNNIGTVRKSDIKAQ